MVIAKAKVLETGKECEKTNDIDKQQKMPHNHK